MISEIRLRIQSELKALHHELIHELPQEIKRALALGDLRENAEYHSALQRQSYVKARIGQLTQRLTDLASFSMASIPKDRIGLGSQVTLFDMVAEVEVKYRIVMNDDADLVAGNISAASPIGRGLSGKRVGDEVTIKIPSGTKQFEVIELLTLHDIEQAAGGGEATRAADLASGKAEGAEGDDSRSPDNEDDEDDD